ncbi:MAG: alpha/beta hydrolase [Candidatus Saccharimonadales bacterium]
MKVFETIWHRYLRVPYTLHVYRYSKVSKPTATLVFLHGIGNSGKTWDEVSMLLTDDVNLIVVDLLGFGDSPKPDWATYDARTQANSLAKTLLKLGLRRNTIVVGHSMGALVAVEFAKRYPVLSQALVLCSPPIYRVNPDDDKKLFVERDEQLRRLYELALRNPSNIVKLSRLAKKYNLLNPDFDVDHMNIDNYVLSLRANILNQTTPQDIVHIKKPIRILYGTLDPFVIGQNIKSADKASDYITVSKFIGGHEITGSYVDRVARSITTSIAGLDNTVQ